MPSKLSEEMRRMAKKSHRPAKTPWSDRRGQVVAGGLITAFILFGLVIPLSAMQFENHDSFCASCHTEGETTFYSRSLAPSTVDLASFHAAKHAARCIDCHTAPGLIGRYGGLMAGTSDLVSYFSGHYPQPAIQDTPIGDGNCTKCHMNVLTDQAFNNHFHAFLPRWQALDPQNAAHCVDCHLSHGTTNDAGAVFLGQNTTVSICQKCHQFAGAGQ
jgi:hypothetical protein